MSDFTIRVYALIEEHGRILLSRERIRGQTFVKFPGGGLEYGEGTRDCLQREIREEMDLDSKIRNHFYTTDFFQPSVFHELKTQVLSIYYRVDLIDMNQLHTVEASSEQPGFFWMTKSAMLAEVVDLPIDRKVARLLMEE